MHGGGYNLDDHLHFNFLFRVSQKPRILIVLLAHLF
jgi:hypothetical protein